MMRLSWWKTSSASWRRHLAERGDEALDGADHWRPRRHCARPLGGVRADGFLPRWIGRESDLPAVLDHDRSSMILSVLVALIFTPALHLDAPQAPREHGTTQRRGFFGWFNTWFMRSQARYGQQVSGITRRPARAPPLRAGHREGRRRSARLSAPPGRIPAGGGPGFHVRAGDGSAGRDRHSHVLSVLR